MKLRAENLIAIIGRDESVNDVPLDPFACRRIAEAGLHIVRNQHFHPDDVAALRRGRNVDQGAAHMTSSRHAPIVTMTLTEPDQNDPSDISAIATTSCVSDSRMRVEKAARPERGLR